MGNELVVGVLAAVLRLKDEMSGTLAGVQQRLGGFSGAVNDSAKNIAMAFGSQQVTQAFAGISRGIGEMVESTSKIADMAGRMGITAEAVQRLGTAAKLGGGSIENVATAMRVMADHITDGKLPQSLVDMGLSIDKLRQMSPDQAFLAIAKAIQDIPDPMKQSATAVDIFGRGAQALLPAIRDGFAGVAAQAPVMSNATVAAGDKIGDKWTEVQLKVDALRTNALMPLLDVFLKLPEPVQTFVGVVTGMLPSLSSIGIGIIAAGGPVAAFGMLSGAMSAVASFIGVTLVPAVGALLPVIGVGGLIVAGLVAVYEAWKHWDQIVAFFKGAWTYVTDVISKIPNSLLLLSGPIGAVIVAFRKWDVISGIAQAVYTGVKTWLIDKFNAIVSGVTGMIDSVANKFKWLQDVVVGHSYVPDMINSIGTQFNRLPSVMVQPTTNATTQTAGLFGGLFQRVDGMLTQFTGGSMTNWMSQMSSFFGPKISGAVNTFQGVMKNGFTVATGIARMFAGDFTGVMDTVMAGINLVKSAWNGLTGLFKSEESKYVNKPRDEFFAQYGGDAALGTALTNASNGDTAEALLRQLYDADTRAKYDAATSAIQNTMNGRGSGIWAGTGGGGMEYSGSGLQGFAYGTGGRYLDFGSGTPVILHGRERVMTESEGRSSGGLTVNVSVSAGTVLGNSDEFRQCVTKAVLDGLELGGDAMTKFRILATQATA